MPHQQQQRCMTHLQLHDAPATADAPAAAAARHPCSSSCMTPLQQQQLHDAPVAAAVTGLGSPVETRGAGPSVRCRPHDRRSPLEPVRGTVTTESKCQGMYSPLEPARGTVTMESKGQGMCSPLEPARGTVTTESKGQSMCSPFNKREVQLLRRASFRSCANGNGSQIIV